MNRLQKKCIVTSASLHGLLAGVVLFGAGFLAGKKPEPPRVIEIIPANAILTDGATRGGGNPSVTTPPAAAPQASQPAPSAPVAPQPPPPKAAQPKTVQREPDPEPPRSAPKKDSFAVSPEAKKPTKRPSDSAKAKAKTSELKKEELTAKSPKTPSKSKTANQSTANALADKKAAQEAARQRSAAIGQALAGIAGGTSKGVGVEIPGPGGQAYVNYRDLILSAYKRRFDHELETAGVKPNRGLSVDVSITITRDGRVVEKAITRSSGLRALDQAVQRVIDSVREIAPFPAEATDARRTFNVTFEPRVDQLAG